MIYYFLDCHSNQDYSFSSFLSTSFQIAFRRTLDRLMSYEKPLFTLYIFTAWMALLYCQAYHLAPSYIVSLLIVVHISNHHDLSSKEKVYQGFEPLSLSKILKTLTQNASTDTADPKKPPYTQCFDPDSYRKIVGDFKFLEEDHVEFPFSESKYSWLPLKSTFCPKGMCLYIQKNLVFVEIMTPLIDN